MYLSLVIKTLIYPHVNQNLYKSVESVEHKRKHFKECPQWFCVYIMEVDLLQNIFVCIFQ